MNNLIIFVCCEVTWEALQCMLSNQNKSNTVELLKDIQYLVLYLESKGLKICGLLEILLSTQKSVHCFSRFFFFI